MDMALAFLRMWWKEIFIVAVIAGGVWYVYNLHDKIDEQQEQLRIAQINIDTLTANNTRLENAAKEANVLVERFDRFAADTRTNFADLNESVTGSNLAMLHQQQMILRERKPQTCEEAIKYLIDAQREFAR